MGATYKQLKKDMAAFGRVDAMQHNNQCAREESRERSKRCFAYLKKAYDMDKEQALAVFEKWKDDYAGLQRRYFRAKFETEGLSDSAMRYLRYWMNKENPTAKDIQTWILNYPRRVRYLERSLSIIPSATETIEYVLAVRDYLVANGVKFDK